MSLETKVLLEKMEHFLETLLLRKHLDEKEAVRIYNQIAALLENDGCDQRETLDYGLK